MKQTEGRWKQAKKLLHRHAKAKSSSTTAASTKNTASETPERQNAQAATAKSFPITSVPEQHESVEPSLLAVPNISTQQPQDEHRQELTLNETGKEESLKNKSTSPGVRSQEEETQNDNRESLPIEISMGSTNEMLQSKKSSGSSSDGGQLNGSLTSETRRRDSTAASSVVPAPLPKRIENVQSPSMATALNHGQEINMDDEGTNKNIEYQVAELDGTSLRRAQSGIVLSTEEATNHSARTLQNTSAMTDTNMTLDNGNAVRVGNLWVLPRPPLEYTRLAVYNKNLKPSVDWLLRFSKGSTKPQGEKAFAEVLMAKRNRFDNFEPTVVFGSRVPKRRQQIVEFLSDGVLKEQFLNFGLSWSIEDTDESSIFFLGSLYVSQTGRQVAEHQSRRRFSVDIGSLPMTTNVCGARIVVQEEYFGDESRGQPMAMMTVGGIIIVDDQPYGLTVAHPISMLRSRRSENIRPKAKWELDDDVYDVLKKTQDGNTFSSHEEFAERSHWPKTHLFRSLGSISAFAYSSQGDLIDVAKNSDWGLISIEPGMIVPNLIHRERGSGVQLIQDIVTQAELPKGENGLVDLPCTIVTAHGPQKARLSHGTSLLEIDGSSFQAKRIELDHPLGKNLIILFESLLIDSLERGDSGSWVIFDDRLCGSILAGREHPPCAYMVPIEDIFNSVIQGMGATRVSLPSKTDSRLFELTLAGNVKRLVDPEIFLLRAYKQRISGVSQPNHDSVLHPKDLLLMSSTMQGHNTLREVYDHLTGLDLSTLNGLILLGDLCPVEENFMVELRENILRRTFGTVRISLNPHLVEIRHQLLKTRAGENLLALILFTEILPVESQAVLFSEMLEMLNIPYSLIPSIPRIQRLLKHCRSLLNRVGRAIQSKLPFWVPDELTIRDQACLVLQLAQIIKCKKSKTLIYGGPRVPWALLYASGALGLVCTVYQHQSAGGYELVDPIITYGPASTDTHVRFYYGAPDPVCELLDFLEPSPLRSLDGKIDGIRTFGLGSKYDGLTPKMEQQETLDGRRSERATEDQIAFAGGQSIAGPSTKEEPLSFEPILRPRYTSRLPRNAAFS
ncbi:hypothetical protein MMC34_003446 [Xylographa carneopallida]|nr:hypothetical protein [Xylographa carneopallida]